MAQGRTSRLRLQTAVRNQEEFMQVCLDALVPDDHRVRAVWEYVEGLDLTALYQKAKSLVGRPGQAMIDPAVLVTLWLYATLEGIGSARQLAQICQRDTVYRWILGGIPVCHKTLSDFRVDAGPVLDDLLSRSVAGLAEAGLVSLECVTVDGMRLRANAGSSSFRSAERLEVLAAAAAKKVAELKAELEADPGACVKRVAARRQRAAEERVERITAARQAAEEIAQARVREAEEQRRKKKDGRKIRASTTDAEARVLSMADGGFRPAYNIRVQSVMKGTLIAGLDVLNTNSDRNQLAPAAAEIEQRYGKNATDYLADGGFDGHAGIETLHEQGIAPYLPWPKTRDGDPRPLKPKDGPGVAAWFQRMSEEAGREIYKQRMCCERAHASMRNQGLTRLLVRGKQKVKAVLLWHVHAFNFTAIMRLKAAKPQAAPG
jgi:transposase